VAAAVREEDDNRPDEVELLFNGERPEVIEGKGGGSLEGVAGEVGEVLQEEDEDQQRAELGEVGSGKDRGDCDGEQGEDVEREDAEGAAGVEVTQTVDGMGHLPKAAGDEEAGESEEENDTAPAELGEVAGEALGGLGGLKASAVVEDEDEEDGEAAEAVECGVASGFGDGVRVRGSGVGRRSGRGGGRIEGWISEGCVGSHLAQRRALAAVSQ